MEREDKCDICGLETHNLVDYYAMLCQECKVKHTDMILIRRIGYLINLLEDNDIKVKFPSNNTSCTKKEAKNG